MQDREGHHRARQVLTLATAALLLAVAYAWGPPDLIAKHPLVVIGALWWGAVVGIAPRDRTPWALLALAAAARWLTYAPRVHLHFAKGPGLAMSTLGLQQQDVRYGDAYVGVLAAPQALFSAFDVHVLDAGLSALVAPCLYLAVAKLLDDRPTAVVAGILAALLPMPVAMAPTETRFVLATTLQVTALAGLCRDDKVGDMLGATAIGLLAFTRPLQIPTALLLLAWAWHLGRRRAALAAGALLGWRAGSLLTYLQHPGAMEGTRGPADALQLPWHAWLGQDATLVMLDPSRTPIVLTVLALAGAGLAWRTPRLRWIVALVVVTILPYLSQGYPSDRMRFQLPAQAWLAVLAAAAFVKLPPRPVGLRITVAIAMGASWWAARSPYPPYTWQAEYALMRRAIDELPADSVVLYHDGQDEHRAVAQWIAHKSEVRWYPVRAPEPEGLLRWVGTADRLPDAPPVPWARLKPVFEREIPANYGGLLDVGDAPVRIGLYVVTAPPSGSDEGANRR